LHLNHYKSENHLCMRKCLPLLSLLTISFLSANNSHAQVADRFAYAVTDMQKGANWNFLRKLNLQTGQFSDILLNGSDYKQVAYDAATKKEITSFTDTKGMGFNTQPAFSSGVAAMAFDRQHNRLYYTPMFIDQLRYIDLKTMKVFYVTDKAFSGRPQKSPDQGNIITRMVIASDGYGYAMTNDATQLIRFSTGKKLQVEDLGTVVDDPANKNTSVHNSCSSFGGDVIADDDGNLYVFSARNHVFKINTESKVATHLGTINGLPNGFTVNGAAVNDDNSIIVASAMAVTSYYKIDLKSLTATPYTISGTVWQSSDLANGNLYVSGNKPTAPTTDVVSRGNPVSAGDSKISIYPNPVTNSQFVMQFTELEKGTYTIQVTDVMGRQVLQQIVNLSGDNQAQTIRMDRSAAKGVYLVKVTDQSSKAVYSSKIILQ
jgi:hypothetical protein